MSFDLTKSSDAQPHSLASLPREDLDLITELVLQSGSLKDLATVYGVSYPTIRSRLDRVIDRLRQAVAGKTPDPFSDLLATLVERGEVSGATARTLRQAARDMLAADAGRGVRPIQQSEHSGGAP